MTLKLFFVIVLIIFALIIVPQILIWSLNTLFNLGIPVTFKTCVAVILLTAALRGNSSKG